MLSKIEEMKLIAKCVLGDDRRAFGTLVEEYQPAIRRFLLTLTVGDDSLCDDLAQETFIKAYTNIRAFKGLSKFSTWLYRIAYNEYCSWARRRHEERISAADNAQAAAEPSANSEAASNAKMDVMAAMSTLTGTERTVVTLFYIDDRSLKNIVEITGLPEGTVKSHLSRARAKMERVLR